MAPRAAKAVEALPEADCQDGCRHPRETYGFFGHAEAEQTLLESFRSGTLPSAIILGGPAGIGKATLAWRLARFLAAYPDPRLPQVQRAESLFVSPDHAVSHQIEALSHPDLMILRRSWNEKTKKFFTEIRAEEVRAAIHLFQQAAGAGGYRICIIDSAEDLNRSSANALLKTLEEPPPKSLFLIVSHKPDSLLPTIRSRCQKLMLKALPPEDVAEVLGDLGAPWSELPEGQREAAAGQAQGSMRDALRLLSGGGIAFDRQVRGLLEALPRLDWIAVHELANQVSSPASLPDYEILMVTLLDWLDEKIKSRLDTDQEASLRQLAALAEVWEKLGEAARETEALNLDKRPFVLSVFSNLARACPAKA